MRETKNRKTPNGLDIKDKESNRKYDYGTENLRLKGEAIAQRDRHLGYLIDKSTGELNEKMLTHLEQTNGRLQYDNGYSVPQNDAEAVKWYRLAADQGLAAAQNNLGFMYYNGRGVPQDYAEAVKWYRLAADQGNARAQNNLGFMYYNGHGVKKDYISAHVWLTLSLAHQSHEELRASRLEFRDIVERDMTAAQIAEAQGRVVRWQPRDKTAR